MERKRAIAATPVRSASEAWRAAVSLVADTLERSSQVPEGSVATHLKPLDGLAPALIAGGHLERDGLVVTSQGLHLTIRLVTGEAAFSVAENLEPVPGGASADDSWMVYLPSVDHLATPLSVAAAKSDHISIDEPPASASKKADEARTGAHALDLDAMRRLGGSR